MKKNNEKWRMATKAIHVGGEPDPSTGAIMPPIYQTSTYVQSSPGQHQGYEYTRSHNPTRSRLEECLASLENADHCTVTASGMSAMALIIHTLPKNATIVCGDDVYGGTYRIFTNVFQEHHNFVFIDTTDVKQVEKTLKQYKPQLLWLETPTNPLLKISDLKKIADAAKANKVSTVVDNTFMSPAFQNPLNFGIDIVVHSLTKFINGHSDVVGGAIMHNNPDLKERLFYLQNAIGPSQSPFDSWLVLRGVKTLLIRMKEHEKNAGKIAVWLEKHPKVEKVLYPGLPSHPQHDLATSQMQGFGGMITFFIKGGLAESRTFLENVKVFSLAESLGGVESLIEHPAIMTHASVPAAKRAQLGISDNLIRLSVGIEDIQDLIDDLETAFKKTR
jgi:cystathionine gamma-lyase